jgi:mono/diheme cytochrome c family protein
VIKYILTAVLTISFATAAFADGAATYAEKCADCHGDKGQGGGKKLKDPIAGAKAADSLKGLEGKDAEDVAAFVEGLKK